MTAFSISARAQPSETKTASRGGVDRADVEAVIGMARNAPPEFAADALITLVENGLVADRRRQRQLLEEAFELASGAQEKIALKRGSGDSPVTSALHGAFHNGIDEVSLRSRVVDSMLKLDAAAARALFEKIDLTIAASSGCVQQTVPDLTLYYVTMFEVVRHIYEPARVEAFLLAHLPRFTSTAQITPFIRVFLQVRGLGRMPALIGAFADRLPELAPDPRAFSSDFDESIEAIAQLLSEAPASTHERLIQQARAWVLANAARGVCAETQKYAVAFNGIDRTPIPYVGPADKFNQEVAWRSRSAGARIERSDVARAEAAPTIANSPEYQENFSLHLLLARDGAGAMNLGDWRARMQDYIARLTGWKSTAANEPRFYLEKSDLLSQLLFIDRHAPPPASAPVRIGWSGDRRPEGPRLEIPGRDRVMAALVDLFASDTAAKVYAQRRVLWFSPVRDLLGLYDRSDRTFEIANLYASASNPLLSLYGHLAKLVASR